MTTPQAYLQTWAEARTRFLNLLKDIKEEELKKKLVNTKNSAGFLIRHIGDVELLFAKNVFGAGEVKVSAQTMIAQHDTGEWTNLQEILEYQQYAFDTLKEVKFFRQVFNPMDIFSNGNRGSNWLFLSIFFNIYQFIFIRYNKYSFSYRFNTDDVPAICQSDV